jgi:hypothetical protein
MTLFRVVAVTLRTVHGLLPFARPALVRGHLLDFERMSSVTDRVRRSTAGSTLPALQKVDLGENAA